MQVVAKERGVVQHVAQSLHSFDPPDCLAVGAWQPYVTQYAAEGPYLHKHTAASRASWAMHEHDVARGTPLQCSIGRAGTSTCMTSRRGRGPPASPGQDIPH